MDCKQLLLHHKRKPFKQDLFNIHPKSSFIKTAQLLFYFTCNIYTLYSILFYSAPRPVGLQLFELKSMWNSLGNSLAAFPAMHSCTLNKHALCAGQLFCFSCLPHQALLIMKKWNGACDCKSGSRHRCNEIRVGGGGGEDYKWDIAKRLLRVFALILEFVIILSAEPAALHYTGGNRHFIMISD